MFALEISIVGKYPGGVSAKLIIIGGREKKGWIVCESPLLGTF